MRGLNGKVVLVAGGAGGIGTATSLRLADEGAAVVVADLDVDAAANVAAAIAGRGGRALAVHVDIGDESSVADMIAAAVGEFGGLDALHANAADLSAGTIGADSDALDIDLNVFDRTLQIDLRGHLLCTRAALPHLLERGGGALVYTSSAAAFVGEGARPAYAIAKSGVNALVRHVATKWGKKGIRANAVAPGLVLTRATYESLGEEFRNRTLKASRSARLGSPDDIAAMVAFLCSSDGEWITGQIISVDGGSTLR